MVAFWGVVLVAASWVTALPVTYALARWNQWQLIRAGETTAGFSYFTVAGTVAVCYLVFAGAVWLYRNTVVGRLAVTTAIVFAVCWTAVFGVLLLVHAWTPLSVSPTDAVSWATLFALPSAVVAGCLQAWVDLA